MNTIPSLTRRSAATLFGDDSGAATAEYAITTMAAVAQENIPRAAESVRTTCLPRKRHLAQILR